MRIRPVAVLLPLALEAVCAVLDGLAALAELAAIIRRVWFPPAPSLPPCRHPLASVAESLHKRSAADLRAIAPAGFRRAPKGRIVAALIALPV